MKFSHSLLKKFVPKLPPKKALVEKLNMHVFEADDAEGDMIDVSIPANHYSDASSYQGFARLVSAMLNLPLSVPKGKVIKAASNKKPPVSVKDKAFCRRMTARYIEDVKIGPSPKWLKDVLKSHGMRSINNLVDVTNYVMLETGQPSHAFDFDKMKGGTLIVRRVKKNEKIETLDNQKFKLAEKMHVLADSQYALDIAGIKGGIKAELTRATKNVFLTAGNFDGVTVYNTSRGLNLTTDASVRFSHDLSPILPVRGNNRATELILELCGGKAGPLVDVYPRVPGKRIIKFDIGKFNSLVGVSITESQALSSLKRLGFKVKGKLVEVPEIRTDVTIFQDLAEEVANIYGYNNIKSVAPRVSIVPPKTEDSVVLREKSRDLLTGLGCDEIYNYSFVSKGELEKTGGIKWWKAVSVENPVSEKYSHLRPSLTIGLVKSAKDNLRFFDTVRAFEVGRNFNLKGSGVGESQALGIVIASKKGNPILELKGLVDQLLTRLGLVHFQMINPTFELPYLKQNETLFVESGDSMAGYLGVYKTGSKETVAIAEFDLEKLERLVAEEKEYIPISRYPIITRDMSLFVPTDVRIGDVLIAMQKTAPDFLRDVDLIDYYEPEEAVEKGKKSLAFRLVFQAENRTLTDLEVNGEVEKISQILRKQFKAEVR